MARDVTAGNPYEGLPLVPAEDPRHPRPRAVHRRSDALPALECADELLARYPVVDWHNAFAAQPTEVPWLVPDVLEEGKSYAFFAGAKVGKSLLLQEIAAGLAAGRPVLGHPAARPVRVLYIDLENSITDVVERMSAYGHGPDELTNLRYLSFPSRRWTAAAAGITWPPSQHTTTPPSS